ncbi:cold-shock protein [Fredinandcohnia quinoae]|uniref:Cold-shock protein n=1 Tax=Fredinandcohnia quinoae TaxID=2918902 RepID=A0AAW5DVM0_9BACI|nr:cold-shock protein [Fredinandcohnia sp. SECRCQ15]MCH1624692.1 cold-shock protein [Fredinandcohnia sp. SECRCQ15]
MAFGRKPVEEIVTEETKIWVCTSDDCNCWLRDNFKSTEIPICPICGSSMEQSTKELQVVDNHCKSYLA